MILIFTCCVCKKQQGIKEDVNLWDDPVINLPEGWNNDGDDLYCIKCGERIK